MCEWLLFWAKSSLHSSCVFNQRYAPHSFARAMHATAPFMHIMCSLCKSFHLLAKSKYPIFPRIALHLLHVPERRAGVALQRRFNMALTASHHPTCGHVRWVGDVHRFDFSSQTPSRTTAIFVDVQAPAPWAAAFSQPWPCWHTAPRLKTANAANNR